MARRFGPQEIATGSVLAAAEAAGNHETILKALAALASTAYVCGDFDAAEHLLQRSIALARADQNLARLRVGLGMLGEMLALSGDLDRAREVLKEAGFSFADVVRINSFVVAREHLKGYMTVRDLYRQEMETFQNPLMVAFYVVSMIVVGSHLWHGVASAFQSLGASQPRWSPRLLVFGKTAAVLIAGAFIVIALWAHFAGARS